MASFDRSSNASPLLTTIGLAVALVAVVGTHVFGWELGSGQPLPTVIGVAAATVAVAVALARRR
ncbi:hypothetical protein [Natrinema salifodinae]|uniref:hypothetical protein n=1 Tax=Natrinema salifodinae TaxID=1202768 RepID=UPI0006788457|nr:hypothetical protein [Natrinema salifodinae]